MDSYEALDLTFLDLSGEDEQVCNEINHILHDPDPSSSASLQLPWKVTRKQPKQQHTTILHHQQPQLSPMINYINNNPPQQYYASPPPHTIQYNYTLTQQPQLTGYYQPIYTAVPSQTIPHHQQQQQLISPVQFNPSVQEFVPMTTTTITSNPSPPQKLLQTENGKVNDEQQPKKWSSLFSSSATSNGSNASGINASIGSTLATNTAVNETNNNDKQRIDLIKHARKASNFFIDPNSFRMGEYLLKHSIEVKTTSLQPRGLINRSNYCYVNSILQALLHCPPLYNLMSELSQQYTIQQNDNRKETPVIDAMCKFIKEFRPLSTSQRMQLNNNNNKQNKNNIDKNNGSMKKDNKEQQRLIDCDQPFEASWMYRMLNGTRTDSFLVEGRQEDAEEFLGCLLNGLNDEMLELMKLVKNDLDIVHNNYDPQHYSDENNEKEWQVMGPKNKGCITRQMDYVQTPISNIFGGLVKSHIHRTGDHATSNIQPFFTLQLNIKKVKTVNEALEALVSKNHLEGVTSVNNTKEQVEAWQQVTLEELPVILILHLKCFDFKSNGGCTKILKQLEFPIDLKIDSKLLSSQPQTPKEKQYKLFAVVYHDGREATKGHYITDAFHIGYNSWIRYDDAAVKAVQEDQVLKPQGSRVPYLLFYRRCDKISRNNKQQ